MLRLGLMIKMRYFHHLLKNSHKQQSDHHTDIGYPRSIFLRQFHLIWQKLCLIERLNESFHYQRMR